MRLVFAALVGCLLNAAPVRAQDLTLAIFLDNSKLPSARAQQFLRLEAATILKPAGVRIEWRDLTDNARQESFPVLIVAGFTGACSADFDANAAPERTKLLAPLASTPVQGGRILPFTALDCDALNRLAAPSLLSDPKARRDFLYGRALGRILAHEVYHILTQTRDHDETGIAKSHFNAREILAEDFSFNEPALALLRLRPAPLDTAPPIDQTDAR
jgi:hypothetical protein